LLAAIAAARTNQSALAREIGVSAQSVQQCAGGKAALSDDTLARAARALKVSEQWLRAGTVADNASENELIAAVSLAMPLMSSRQLAGVLSLTEAFVGNDISHANGKRVKD
jgi:transcriptional regulator with XRE-family HTH domain